MPSYGSPTRKSRAQQTFQSGVETEVGQTREIGLAGCLGRPTLSGALDPANIPYSRSKRQV